MTRPSVSMPALQYDHLLPGSKSSGCCELTSTASASVRLASLIQVRESRRESAGQAGGVRQQVSQRDDSRGFLERDAVPFARGNNSLAAKLRQMLLDRVVDREFPSSCRIMMPTAVIGLVIDAIRNSASFGIGCLVSIFWRPTASSDARPSFEPTAVTAPGDHLLIDERLHPLANLAELRGIEFSGRQCHRREHHANQPQSV